MRKKDIFLYALIIILVLLFLWQWLSKGALISQAAQSEKNSKQISFLSGIGVLRSAHLHADVKVYINGKALDFSQKKYQVTNSFIHFEEGIGDVIHTHATGLTIGHLFKSVDGDINNNCLAFERQSYCNENDRKLRFYVNGQPNNEFDNKVINNLDKYLVTYGNENESEIQTQLSSVTNLAPKYSLQK